MKIWVDADACPVVLRDILYRLANRTEIVVSFIANHFIKIPPSRYLKFIQVEPGFDVADNKISQKILPGDLVITADIPLAAEVVDKGGIALNFRGELYTLDNIRACLNMRNFMETLRSSGVETGGPPAFNHSDRHAFANQLDKLINRAKKNENSAYYGSK